MKISIEGKPKEIAALVVALQERQEDVIQSPVQIISASLQQAIRGTGAKD